MSAKTMGLVVAIVGVLCTLFSATGHLIGILDPGFGPRQIAGTVIGVVILIVGIALYIYASRKEKTEVEPEAE
jgi:hypothetical protein